MKHFDLVGMVDVQPILKDLTMCDELWKIDRFRNSTPGTPHVDTQAIFLRMPKIVNTDSIFNDLEIVNWPATTIPAFCWAIEEIGRLAYAHPARAMLVNLKAGGHIRRHVDQGRYSDLTDRYHLCVTTNNDCVMQIADEKVISSPEQVWWFDKEQPHEVINGGSTDRIHLICDVWKD